MMSGLTLRPLIQGCSLKPIIFLTALMSLFGLAQYLNRRDIVVWLGVVYSVGPHAYPLTAVARAVCG